LALAACNPPHARAGGAAERLGWEPGEGVCSRVRAVRLRRPMGRRGAGRACAAGAHGAVTTCVSIRIRPSSAATRLRRNRHCPPLCVGARGGCHAPDEAWGRFYALSGVLCEHADGLESG